jgi:periplasmic divalent cation tolerance protein
MDSLMARRVAASLVLVTVPDRKTARLVAQSVLDARLAACVQILSGLESHYLWKGRKEVSRELLLILKTRTSRLGALRSAVEAVHPYETPQFVAVDIDSGSPGYLDWIAACVPWTRQAP